MSHRQPGDGHQSTHSKSSRGGAAQTPRDVIQSRSHRGSKSPSNVYGARATPSQQELRTSRTLGVHAILNPSTASQALVESSPTLARTTLEASFSKRSELQETSNRLLSQHQHELARHRTASPAGSLSSLRRESVHRRTRTRSPSAMLLARSDLGEQKTTVHEPSVDPISSQRRRRNPVVQTSAKSQLESPSQTASRTVRHSPEFGNTSATVHASQDLIARQETFRTSLAHQGPATSISTFDFSQFAPRMTETVPMVAHASGSSAFQYMTMETEHGPVSFPVDIQAASRMADERRRRNAGASARFRARRKEKEHANTQELTQLRQQIQDLEEDVVFYRSERDYFARLHRNTAGRDGHPRPTSPRHRRAFRLRPEAISFGSTSGHESIYQDHGERDAEERYTRRRLSGPSSGEGYAGPPLPSIAQSSFYIPQDQFSSAIHTSVDRPMLRHEAEQVNSSLQSRQTPSRRPDI